MQPLRFSMVLCLLVLTGLTGSASAANYTLWINGRTGSGTVGDYDSWTYWGPSGVDAGVNKKSANWDGRGSIASQSPRIRDALDCFCTGANWCYIATHSAGDLLIGYTLAHYGASTRTIRNAVANANGVCAAGGGSGGQPRPAGTSSGWPRRPAPAAARNWRTSAPGPPRNRWCGT